MATDHVAQVGTENLGNTVVRASWIPDTGNVRMHSEVELPVTPHAANNQTVAPAP